MHAPPHEKIGLLRSLIASIGAAIIYGLIALFGRSVQEEEVPWLVGPHGDDYIGDRPYQVWAERENLTVERRATEGGLVPDMSVLESDLFQVDAMHKEIRRFYERTAKYRNPNEYYALDEEEGRPWRPPAGSR